MRWFIQPSAPSEQGHMDRRRAGIHSTIKHHMPTLSRTQWNSRNKCSTMTKPTWSSWHSPKSKAKSSPTKQDAPSHLQPWQQLHRHFLNCRCKLHQVLSNQVSLSNRTPQGFCWRLSLPANPCISAPTLQTRWWNFKWCWGVHSG